MLIQFQRQQRVEAKRVQSENKMVEIQKSLVYNIYKIIIRIRITI